MNLMRTDTSTRRLARAAAWAALVTSMGAGASSPALAQNTAYLPMGGRTGTMGGTGVAFGDDAAMGLINPAGLAGIDRDTLALSLSVYSFEQAAVDDFFAQSDPPDFMGIFTLDDNDISSNVIRAIPTSLAYFIHFGQAQHHVVGFSVLSPRSIQREFDGTLRVDGPGIFLNEGSELVDSQATYFIGPSYAVELAFGDLKVRGGASAYLAYSTLTKYLGTETLAGPVPTTSYATIEAGRYEDGDSFDLVFAVGAQVHYGAISVGVSVQPPSAHLTGNLQISATAQNAGAGLFETQPESITVAQIEGDYEQAFPLRIGAGFAVDLDPVLLAIDLTYSAELEYDRFVARRSFTTITEGQNPEVGTSRDRRALEQKAVTNVSAGAEIRLSPDWLLRLGGFTDFSATKFPDRSERDVRFLFDDKLDRFGGTLGVATQWGSSETAIGFSYVRGTGEMLGNDAGNLRNNPSGVRVVDVGVNTFALSIAGTVDLESLLTN